ncbi:MAG: TadE/TadG family type IV pilus assembly protein [Pseudomonadota bacterium]|nr:TadE/TadG family type IV pilus assembly protein [Pseudomonadota bacterium]
MRLHRQKGSTLVEMSIVLLLFLMVIFAVIEFSIAIYRSAQLEDATRDGLRYAIVNNPVGTLPSCPDGTAEYDASEEMINRMAYFSPIINSQSDDIEVKVKYSCPASGYIDSKDVYLVTVTVSGAKHYLTVPGVLGLDATIDLQEFKSTRLSEDLHTAVPGG